MKKSFLPLAALSVLVMACEQPGSAVPKDAPKLTIAFADATWNGNKVPDALVKAGRLIRKNAAVPLFSKSFPWKSVCTRTLPARTRRSA